MGKICSRCKQERPLSAFWGRPSAVDGLRGRCIDCCKAVQAVWNQQNAERKRAANQAYFEAHRDENAMKSRAYYRANKEAMNDRARIYAVENHEAITKRKRQARLVKGDELRANRRQHYRDNSARYKAQAVARKAHIKQATPPWADLEKIAAIYAEAERLTDETGVPHHVDHFYPLRGKTMCGLHVEGNLRIITKNDNLRKGNAEPAEPGHLAI